MKVRDPPGRLIKVLLLWSLCVGLSVGNVRASELTTFEVDYDNNIFYEDTVIFEVSDEADASWYPLRAASLYLPIEVSWDHERDCLLIEYEALGHAKLRYTREMLASDPEITLVNGTTYCSPRFLCSFLGGRGFVYSGEIYYLAGEIGYSPLIRDGGNTRFRERALTSLYMLELVMPEAYGIVCENLSGGIEYVSPFDSNTPFSAVGYVYPSHKNPTCYIVGNYSGATLSSYIAHEAYHVWQYREYGYTKETDAAEYERRVYNSLREINEEG